MQRVRVNRRGIKLNIIFAFSLIFLVLLDQILKSICVVSYNNGWNETTVIKDFFYLTFSLNDGAGFSFGAGTTWGQPLFKALTCVSLVIFYIYYIYVCKKNYILLRISLILIIGGTIGNFIDRIAFGHVVDFISFVFGSYKFPIFNFADIYLTIGVILLIIHYLFLDNNAIFKKDDKKRISNNKWIFK